MQFEVQYGNRRIGKGADLQTFSRHFGRVVIDASTSLTHRPGIRTVAGTIYAGDQLAPGGREARGQGAGLEPRAVGAVQLPDVDSAGADHLDRGPGDLPGVVGGIVQHLYF